MKVSINIFKKTGKFYTDEIIEVPDETKTYLIREAVKRNRRITDMITVSIECPERDDFYPFLILADKEEQ